THLFRSLDPALEDALDWPAIRNPHWADAPRGERRKTMAEVLVNGALAPRHIQKVWVQKPSALRALAQHLSPADLTHCRIDERQELFYA
ncbi:MAG: DarT ssDNA thymidine ADP-ribosyltransferase family protein, partial [Synechococcaceae cyanobacterium]